MKKFNIIITTIISNAQVIVEDGCNAITFINQGATIAQVNGIILQPGSGTASGESFTFGGHQNELFRGRIDVGFPSTAIGKMIVIQKVYLQFEK